MEFTKSLIKAKILIDYLIEDFNNSYKFLFMVDELNLNSPKELCIGLNMAKSNLAVLAGKLRLLKYLEQHKSGDNQKEIIYKVTPLGRTKLQNKISEKNLSAEDKNKIVGMLKQTLSLLK